MSEQNIDKEKITSIYKYKVFVYLFVCPRYKDTRICRYEETGIQENGYKDTGIHGYRDTRIQGFKKTDTRMQGYMDIGIQAEAQLGLFLGGAIYYYVMVGLG